MIRLYWTSLWMFLKLSIRGHGGCGLPCLAVVMGAAALLAGTLPSGGGPAAPAARIAIINQDENLLTGALLSRALAEESFSGRIEARLAQEGEDLSDCVAVVRLPAGFLDGVMSGENRPPEITLRLSSPAEALCVGEIALALERDLSNAQAGIQAILSTPGARSLSPQERQRLLLDANLSFADAFLTRGGRIQEEELKGAGALSLAAFAAASGLTLLLLCMTFLWADGAGALAGFGRRLGLSVQKRMTVAAGVWSGVFAFEFLAAAALSLWLGGRLGCAVPLAALLTAFGFFFCSYFHTGESCLRVLAPVTAALGVLGGCFLPPVLLPKALLALAPFLPVTPAMSLVSSLFGAPLDGRALFPAAAWTVVLTAAALPVWIGKGARE